ncbi:MAG TPA: hypothetical protein PLP61_06230 [Nocardioides sp.]|uniref:hypothetical protein n=1 Tax=Nocardioides sp. TaxID=35761 RepID=UPI002CEE53D9|nr:hypothetical protein [Nocardioides sp.]HQR26622.1 hypothetical protein [Nocardioides sp.]
MATRLVLHIGAMKSGTSFIQNVLKENKETLEAAGWLFPGRRWRQQVSAVYDLIERGGARQEPMAADGPWHTICAEVNDWDGEAVISMEFLGPRGPEKIQQLMRSFPDTELQVVLTARDLARSIPAMWQESVQNAATSTWPEFLDAVRREARQPGPGRWFWRHQGLAAMAERWRDQVGNDHFTLVTVPRRGAPSSLLWDRFAQVAGLAPGDYTLDVLRNPSIGAASAMVMRDLNERLSAQPLPRDLYDRLAKHALAKQSLADRQRTEPVLGLDAEWVRSRGAQEVEQLRRLGLRVVGDLAELVPQPVPGVHTDDISPDQRLDAALAALEVAVRRWADAEQRARPRRPPRQRAEPTEET